MPTTASAAGQKTSFVSLAVLGLYVFLLVSRLPEFTPIFGLGSPPVLMVVAIFGLLLVAATGGVLRCFSSTLGKLILLFTFWLLVATVTSTWHGGSVSMLREQWSRTLLVYVIISGAVTAFGQFRIVAFAVGWGTAFAGVMSLLLGNSIEGRFGVDVGMIGNPNLLAAHLLFGVPFCFYVIQESGITVKLIMYAVIAVITKVILGTGSRSGLITMAVLMAMILLHVSVMNKLKLVVGSAVLLAIGFSYSSSAAMERYRTMFSDEAGSEKTMAYRSAVGSEDQRRIQLKESLTLTFQHPLFGVGPGVFTSASADHQKELGQRQEWRETHNGYTQVSSECGIPGFILFLSILGGTWLATFRMGRAAKAAGNTRLMNLVFYLKLSLMAFTVDAIFTSNAYQYYLLLLTAMTVTLEATTVNLASRVAVETKPIRVEAPAPIPAPAAPPRSPQPVGAGPRLGFGGYRRARG
jgi:O-antigen ligase